jgi:hypothetical protein
MLLLIILLCQHNHCYAQADNEIQVYASPTIPKKNTIVELHNNYSFRGTKGLADQRSARWVNHTLEITQKNVELSFYTFVALSPDGVYQYGESN